MRDDINPPNLGKASELYDKFFFFRSYRDLEIFLSQVLQKGPLTVSDLTTDSITLTGDFTVTGTSDFVGDVGITGSLEIVSNDPGASAGPVLTLYRNSVSPAASDNIGQLVFTGEDSLGNKQIYIALTGRVDDPTSGSEDSGLILQNFVAGAAVTQLTVSSTGLQIPAIGETTPGTGVFTTVAVAANAPVLNIRDTNNTGVGVTGFVRFQDSALTQVGYVGRGSAGNQDIYVANAIASSHVRLLTTGTGVVILENGGLQFPAVQVPSANVNTLDDYEEGTFTPVVVGLTTAGVGTYTTQTGAYTKIGRLVHVNIVVTTTAHTGTGNMAIQGLPFTAAQTTSFSIVWGGLTYTSTPMAFVSAGTSTISLRQAASGGAAIDMPIDTAFAAFISGSYHV